MELVVVTTAGCGKCKDVLKNARAAALLSRPSVSVRSFDISSRQAAGLGVTQAPVSVLLKEVTELWRASGPVSVEEFREVFKRFS